MVIAAAPGNKTTYLAAIADERGVAGRKPEIYAYEKDKARALTLQQMVRIIGAESYCRYNLLARLYRLVRT